MAINVVVENTLDRPLEFLTECKYCKSILSFSPEDMDNDPYWERYIQCPVCNGLNPMVDNPSKVIEVDLDKQCGFYYHADVLIPEDVKVYSVHINKDTLVLKEENTRILAKQSSVLLIGSGIKEFKTVNCNKNSIKSDASPVRVKNESCNFTTIDQNLNPVLHTNFEIVNETSVIIPGLFNNVEVIPL